MKRYVIERNLPGVGTLNREQLKDAAATSNGALAKLPGKVQWLQSFVADDKTFCVYLAQSEAAVHEHARLSGFPATKITEVRGTIGPMTATSCSSGAAAPARPAAPGSAHRPFIVSYRNGSPSSTHDFGFLCFWVPLR